MSQSSMINSENIHHDKKGHVLPWAEETGTSLINKKRKAQIFSARMKRCKVCGGKMSGSFLFTGHKEDFTDKKEFFPRMAMHFFCAVKMNLKERYPVLARNERYIEREGNGYKTGRWVEHWIYNEVNGKWQVINGGQGIKALMKVDFF